MTIPDIIDEALTELGGSKVHIESARIFAVSQYCKTAEKKEMVNRELTDSEIEHYRTIVRLFLMTVIMDPDKLLEVKKEIQDDIELN